MQAATAPTQQRFLRPGQLAVSCALLALVVISALSVIYSTYRSRQLFNELQQLQRAEWNLDEDWERLLLEQGTWASHERVSQQDVELCIRSDRIELRPPAALQIGCEDEKRLVVDDPEGL